MTLKVPGGGSAVKVADAATDMWFKWAPHEITRGAIVPAGGGLTATFNTSVRIRFQQAVILFRADIVLSGVSSSSFSSAADVAANLSLQLPGVVAFSGPDGPAWGWPVPRPTSANGFTATETPCGDGSAAAHCVVSRDHTSSTVVAIGVMEVGSTTASVDTTQHVPTATWRLTAGLNRVEISVAIGNNTADTLAAAALADGGFDAAWLAALDEWEQWWQDVFTPATTRRQRGHGRTTNSATGFAGHLPTLDTSDAALARVYYMGVMSLLQTAHLTPTGETMFGSAGPVFAVTAEYYFSPPPARNIMCTARARVVYNDATNHRVVKQCAHDCVHHVIRA